MADAALVWNDFGADVALAGGDLVPDNGLGSAVLISLFTDARAPDASALPAGEVGLRGWWGDLEERTTGSLLWLISREKTTEEVAERAREYCVDALQWLIDDGIAETVEVETLLVRPVGLQIKIRIIRGTALRYSSLWAAVRDYSDMVVQKTSYQIIFIDS